MVTMKFPLGCSSYLNQLLPNRSIWFFFYVIWFLSSNTFLDIWKKANVIPVHKKGDKQVLENHWPVSLLRICGKIFEELIFIALYFFFEDHKLLNPCQSGIKKNYSCINQLVSITHENYFAFDCNPLLEVRCVFWIFI